MSDTKSLFELLLNKVQGEGVQQAAAFEVTLSDGTTFVLRSQGDERLRQQVDPETVKVKVLQTAVAGLTD